jgi:hypothetical protein
MCGNEAHAASSIAVDSPAHLVRNPANVHITSVSLALWPWSTHKWLRQPRKDTLTHGYRLAAPRPEGSEPQDRGPFKPIEVASVSQSVAIALLDNPG